MPGGITLSRYPANGRKARKLVQRIGQRVTGSLQNCYPLPNAHTIRMKTDTTTNHFGRFFITHPSNK